MKTSKTFLWIFILLMLWANFSFATDDGKDSMEKVKLDVKGMTCSACAASVESALKGVKGVKIADVNYPSGEAVVEFENSKTEPKELISAVEKAGFKAAIVDSKLNSRIKLQVQGMTCSGCAASVTSALKQVNGVKKAEVNYQNGQAVIEIKKDNVATKDLISAVEKAGFKASVSKPEDEGKNTDKIKSRK